MIRTILSKLLHKWQDGLERLEVSNEGRQGSTQREETKEGEAWNEGIRKEPTPDSRNINQTREE